MYSANRAQSGGQWDTTGGWDDDDLFDSPSEFGSSHSSNLQPQASTSASSAFKSNQAFSSDWDDDEPEFFSKPAPTAQPASHPASNGHHLNGNRQPQVLTPANGAQVRLTPTNGGNLFAPTSTGRSDAPVPQSAPSAAPSSSKAPLASQKPVSGFEEHGWDDHLDFSEPTPAPTATAPKRAAVTPQPTQATAKSTAPASSAQRVAQVPTGQVQQPAKATDAARPQTRPVPASAAVNGTAPVRSASNTQLPSNSTASTPAQATAPVQTAVAPVAAQTPLKQAAAPSHQGTPIVASAKATGGETKTPVGLVRKPSSSIKLPTMPTRTPQPKAPQAAPAAAAPVAPVSTAAPVVAATPQTIAAVPKVPGSSKRLTEDGKPIPLTRVARPTTPDLADVQPVEPQAAPASLNSVPAASIAPKKTAPVAAPKKAQAAPPKAAPVPLSVAKPTSEPISFDWGDDETEAPATLPLTEPSASEIVEPSRIPAEVQTPTATISTPEPKPIESIKPIEAAANEPTPAPSDKQKQTEMNSWDDGDWGESDDEDGSVSLAPSATPKSHTAPTVVSSEPTAEVIAPIETAPVEPIETSSSTSTSASSVKNSFEMDWGEDEELTGPSTPVPVTNDEIPNGDLRAKIDALVPKSAAPSVLPPASNGSEDILAQATESKPKANTDKRPTTVAFVPPQIPHTEAPAAGSTAPQPHAPAPSVGVFQPSAPSGFAATPPLPSGSDLAALPKQPKKTAVQPPKPRVTVPGPSAFPPSTTPATTPSHAPGPAATPNAISTFIPTDPTTSMAPTPAMASGMTPSHPSAPQVRQARPKATAPKLQPVYNTPFGGATTPATAAPTSRVVRSSHPGPLTLEDMRKPRAVATFGFGGMLVMTQPRLASAFSNQPPQAGAVSLLSTGQLLSNVTDVIAMKAFPGPALSKSVKELSNTLTTRCKHADQDAQHMIGANQANPVREASRLLWHMLRLLMESKGTLSGPKGCEKAMHALLAADSALSSAPNGGGMATPPPSLDPMATAILGDCTDSLVSLEKRKSVVLDVQRLMQIGKREEALAVAVKEGIWDHALLLASFISPSVHRDTVSAFVLSTLSIGSPLRMAYLQISSKSSDLFKLGGTTGGMILPGALVGGPMVGGVTPGPAAANGFNPLSNATQSNPYHGLIDHWKTNIATAVANKAPTPVAPASSNPQQPAQTWHEPALMQLGDALWQHCSSVEAAHLCYLLADYGLDAFSPRSRFVLVGADHKRHPRTFAWNVEAIHRTELLEFAKRQNNNKFCFPRFQPYKLAHAIALADMGLLKLSLEYLESIKHIVGSNVKVAAQTYPAQFLTKLDEWHARIKDATSGKPIANVSNTFSSNASSNSSGAASTAAGWFGNILKAAVDKVIGDEEEERRQMQGSQGMNSSLGVTAPGAPTNSSGSIPPPSLNGSLNGPIGAQSGLPNGGTAPVSNNPLVPGGPQLLPPNAKFGFPMHSVGPKMGLPHSMASPKAPVMMPTNNGPLSGSPNVPLVQGAPSTPGLAKGPMPPIPLPSVRGAPPKANAKAPKLTAATNAVPAVSPSPEPVQPPTASLSEDEDDKELSAPWGESKISKTAQELADEAELFDGSFGAPSTNPGTPSLPTVTKTAQELADEAELFDGSFAASDMSTPSTIEDSDPKPESSENTDSKSLVDEVQQEGPVALTEESVAAEKHVSKPSTPEPSDVTDNSDSALETSTASPNPIAGFLPPPKRGAAAAPRKSNRSPVAAFRPSGSTPAPAKVPLAPKGVEESLPSDEADEPIVSPELDVDVSDEPTPPLTPEVPHEEPSTPSSQTSSASSLDIREATSRVKPPKTKTSDTSLTAVPTPSEVPPPSAASQPPPPATVTPKRPSLLPPKKTPASKPAGSPSSPQVSSPPAMLLDAPEGLPPLSAVAKQPFKPVAASSALPPSTQQKRAERMNKSISASTLPRPDVLAQSDVSPDVADDGAHSDDERAQEKVLQDAKAEIDRQDASIVPPASKLPPIANASKPKEASKRKPMPRPQPHAQPPTAGFTPSVFAPVAAPPAESTFTPPKTEAPISAQPTPQQSYGNDDSDSEDDSMKTPQQKPKKEVSKKDAKKDKEVKDAPKTEPKRSRFGWINPRNWFGPKTPQPTKHEVHLGGDLKDSFYRHAELGWVERGKEDEKRAELAARAAPPTKSEKKRAKPSAETNASGDGLVTPQATRGSFSRAGGVTGEEPSTPSVLGSSNGVPGSSRGPRGRRYVGSSGDVIDTKRSSGGSSLFPVAPTTPSAGSNGISVFTPMARAPDAEDDSSSTAETLSTSQEPLEPVATVKQPKKVKEEKTKKEKTKKSKTDEEVNSEEEQDHSQPLTYSASIPVEEVAEDTSAPRKSRAERKAEAAAVAATTAPPPSSSAPPTSGPKKFGSPFGFRPSKGSSSSPRGSAPSISSVGTPDATSHDNEDEDMTPKPTEMDSAQDSAEVDVPEPEAPVAAPLPTAGLHSFNLPPAGAARAKSGVKAARPKSAAARFQPTPSPPAQPK